MDKIERQINEVKAVLNVIRENRKQLKGRIQQAGARRRPVNEAAHGRWTNRPGPTARAVSTFNSENQGS